MDKGDVTQRLVCLRADKTLLTGSAPLKNSATAVKAAGFFIASTALHMVFFEQKIRAAENEDLFF